MDEALRSTGLGFGDLNLQVDVASQGATFDEARATLTEALTLFLKESDAEVGEAPVITPIGIAV